MGRRLKYAAAGMFAAAIAGTALHVASTETQTPSRVFGTTKGGELSAEIPGTGVWCQPDVTFVIRGQDDTHFTTGEIEQGRKERFLLNRLLSAVRRGLQQECPQAKSVTFNGFVDDVFVYRGYASRDNPQGEWILIDMPVVLVEAPPPPPVAQAATAQAPVAAAASTPRRESIAECDTLAAHPDDPEKPKGIAGVADDDIHAGHALTACEEAIQAEPGNSRLKFQLARAYLLYDKPSEAVELLIEAAEEGHGAAIASLADLVLYGALDGEPDPETAKSLYQQAARAGFKPADKLAAEIVSDPEEDKNAQVAGEPEYHQPNRIAALLKGEPLAESGRSFAASFIYSLGVMGGIKHHCPDAGIDIPPQQLMQKYMQRMGSEGFGAILMGGVSPDLEQHGMDDGYALAFTKGCPSKEVAAVHAALTSTFR